MSSSPTPACASAEICAQTFQVSRTFHIELWTAKEPDVMLTDKTGEFPGADMCVRRYRAREVAVIGISCNRVYFASFIVYSVYRAEQTR